MSEDYSIKDPLGEITRLAKAIWLERNQPAGTTWKDFASEAEKQLIVGLGDEGSRADSQSGFIDVGAVTETNKIRGMRFPLIAALMGIPEGLNQHECFCLAIFLLENEVRPLPDHPFHSCLIEEIAELMLVLASEYEHDLVDFPERCAPYETDLELVREYWLKKIREWRDADLPLTYSDRNTIERLRDLFLDTGAFCESRLR